MQQKMNRQQSTRNCSQQLYSSRKPKSIKSIRIVDTEKQKIPFQQDCFSVRQDNISRQQKYNVQQKYREQSSGHQFSFKKQLPQNANRMNQAHQDQLICALQDKVDIQQQQLTKLQRMLISMRRKINCQQQQYLETKQEYHGFDSQMHKNAELKLEILQLKELMKELIIQKDNHGMVLFSNHS